MCRYFSSKSIGRMRLLVCFVFLSLIALSSCGTGEHVYLQTLSSVDSFNEFIQTDGGLRVIYFYSLEFAGIEKFLSDLEKSAAVMDMYDAQFALVDCNEHPAIGECKRKASDSKVYLYRKGRFLIHVPRQAMFDVNSIVSNVLQAILVMDVRILRSTDELKQLHLSNAGVQDIIFSYQKSLGTYAHRILLEVIYAYRTQYQYAITNDQLTVQDLPGYSSTDESAIWLMRCRDDVNNPCSVIIKYTGGLVSDNLAQFFRLLDMRFMHYIGEDGDYNPFEDNNLHTVFIFYDKRSESAAKNIGDQLIVAFYTQLGVIMVNINEVNPVKFGFQTHWKLPAVVLKPHQQNSVHHMTSVEDPVPFIVRVLGSVGTSQVQDEETDKELPTDQEKQDDEVAELGVLLKDAIGRTNFHHFSELTRKTYYAAVKHRQRPLMLLYHIAFDARSQVFLSIYDEISKEVSQKGSVSLAAVNCFDWTDVCENANVSTYPTIRVYLRGNSGSYHDYNGILSKKALLDSIKLYSYSVPWILNSRPGIDEFMIGSTSESFVFGGFRDGDKDEIAAFSDAAVELHGKIVLGLTTGSSSAYGCTKFKVQPPCVVVIRPHDKLIPYSVLTASVSADELVRDIRRAQMNSLPELTVENFPYYNSLVKPFVIAFISGAEETSSGLLTALAALISERKESTNDVVFSWMDLSKSEAALLILKHYVENPGNEELLLINRQKGLLHRFTGDMTHSAIGNWLKASLAGKIPPTKLMAVREWKPAVVPYDFLAKIDAEQAEAITSSSNSHDNFELDEAVVQSEMPDTNLPEEIRRENLRLLQAQLYKTQDNVGKPREHDEF